MAQAPANPGQPAPTAPQGQAPAKTPAKGAEAPKTTTPAPTPAEIRKLKLKVEGQELELPESEVIARAQQSTVAAKRFQEAAQLRKQAEEVLKFAKENPTEFFKRTGMNARQWAEEYLIGELKREQMTPEQKKAAENEEKLKEYAQKEKDEADRKKREEDEKQKNLHLEKYNQLFVEALGKSGLPKTPFTVMRMATLQKINLAKKLDLSADQLAKLVREDYINEQKHLFGALEGDQILEFLGQDIVKKLSKAQLAKLKAKHTPASGSSRVQPTSQEKQSMSWREYQLRNRGRLPK